MKPYQAQLRGLECLLFLLALSLPVSTTWAATYHVHGNGGNASECTGLSDAPYPGSGSNRDCAWEHPFIALPPGGSPRISGGDTLIVGSGSYRMGLGAPGAENCGQGWSWDCVMPPVPSGPSESQKTRILGAGHDSGCSNPPELWGAERARFLIDLDGSSNVELACMELTDHESCIEFHCHNGQCDGEIDACNRGSPPFGNWAGTGIVGSDSGNVLLRDLNIHGMANRGIHAGGLSDWTMQRVRIAANGWAGWDGDIGDASSNSGTIHFIESEISWNGCAERWPGEEKFGCWAQGGGGYGDGLGTAETAGHWVFDRSRILHNTSDGIDLLYLREDGQVTIRRTLVDSNASNQVKVSRSALIENSVIVGNCGFFEGEDNMRGSDHCRALGDTVSVGLSNGAQTDLINNTIIGQGNCVISGGGGTSDSRIRFINNLVIATPYWHDPSKQSCLYYSGASEQVVWDNNFIHQPRNDACPGNSLCSGTPGIVDASIASFDGQPREDSALIAGANAGLAPANDFFGNARGGPDGPDIGAIEYQSTVDPNDRVFIDDFN